MSAAVSLQQRLQQLKKLQVEVPEVLKSAARQATKRAVRATQDATPPKAGTGRTPGTGTITGELKARWATDSVLEPVESAGGAYVTALCNDAEYASYVNDGHRMDRHFVPGLYVNPYSGLLEYDPGAKVGLVVGTKTRYVKGEFMVDKGKEEYEKAVRSILDRRIKEMLK